MIVTFLSVESPTQLVIVDGKLDPTLHPVIVPFYIVYEDGKLATSIAKI